MVNPHECLPNYSQFIWHLMLMDLYRSQRYMLLLYKKSAAESCYSVIRDASVFLRVSLAFLIYCLSYYSPPLHDSCTRSTICSAFASFPPVSPFLPALLTLIVCCDPWLLMSPANRHATTLLFPCCQIWEHNWQKYRTVLHSSITAASQSYLIARCSRCYCYFTVYSAERRCRVRTPQYASCTRSLCH